MEKKTLSKIKKFILGEIIVLAVVLLLCGGWIFPLIAGEEMLHVTISIHTFMIGITATAFSLFAILFRRVWRSHKIFVLIPVVFTVFGYLMLVAANNINL